MLVKNILVPLDFSDNSDRALEYAVQFAKLAGAKITLLHAVVMYQYDFNDDSKIANYEEMLNSHSVTVRGNLEGSKKDISAQGLAVETVIERGVSAVDIILKHLEANVYDLLIMGTQGRTGLKHLLQGSTAEKIVRYSPVPVLTIHNTQEGFSLEHILIPIDFSESSHKAIAHAIDLQGNSSAKITFLHVVETPVYPAYYAAGAGSVFDVDDDLKNRVIENMKKFAEDVGIENSVSFEVSEGLSHQVIVDYARSHDVDLIVIATRGLTGLEHMLMGSTTEKVVRLTNLPVITFKE